MARTFKDRRGRAWQVWEVYPTMTERRVSVEPVLIERRRHAQARASLPDGLRYGWLAFESNKERRRLGPPPEHWAAMTDSELAALVERAVSAGTSRRLIE